MKKLHLLVFFVCCCGFAQKKNTLTYNFQETLVDYTRIDYPKHGIANVFVTFYEETNEKKGIVEKAEKCLSRESNIYHTYFYFVKLPQSLSTTERKNMVLGFVQHIWQNDDLVTADLYLNFGTDYSEVYRKESVSKSLPAAKRINTSIDTSNICKNMDIVRNIPNTPR